MLTRLRLLLWATALALAGEVCAGGALPRFSAQSAGAAIAGWTPWTLGGKAAPADFRLTGLDGQTVLRAEAVNAASALIHAGRFDTAATPWLNWRWRLACCALVMTGREVPSPSLAGSQSHQR